MSNLVRWGYIVRNISPQNSYLISKIIRKRIRQQVFIRDENERVLGEDE